MEREIADFGKEQGKRVAAAKTKLAAAKAGAETAKKALKAAQAACAEAVARREAAGSERAALSEQLKAAMTAAEGENPCLSSCQQHLLVCQVAV